MCIEYVGGLLKAAVPALLRVEKYCAERLVDNGQKFNIILRY